MDRTKTSRLLAKCIAYYDCGKMDIARAYMGELAGYLEQCINAKKNKASLHNKNLSSNADPGL